MIHILVKESDIQNVTYLKVHISLGWYFTFWSGMSKFVMGRYAMFLSLMVIERNDHYDITSARDYFCLE